jgi:hypothetical protein
MTWRDIKGEAVNWKMLIRSRCYINVLFRFKPPWPVTGDWSRFDWSDLTLGEVCDRGVGHWERAPNWGQTTTREFKEALREIVREPEKYLLSNNGKARDAFDPERRD